MASKGNGKGNGTAIDPRTFGGSRGLAIVPSGAVQQVAFAQAARTNAKAGLDIDTLRVRLLAAGVPLWARTYNAADFAFMVGRAPGGKVSCAMHAYRHDTPKGKPTACVGGHGVAGVPCKASAPSMGDNVRRYATDAAFGPATLDNAAECARLALARLRECAANLRSRGASTADMLATPSLAWYAAHSPAMRAAIVGSKPASKPAKRASKPDAASTPADAPATA